MSEPEIHEENEREGNTEVDPIDKMIFSANLFWAGGATHTLRLDEINALRERQLAGDDVMIGDTSARMLSEQVLKNAGLLHNRLAPRLIVCFARALLDEFGSNPNEELNPQHKHEIRQRQLRAMGALAETEPERDRGLVSGFQKPANPDRPDYDSMNVEELKEELRTRNLPQGGNKKELIERLRFNDISNPEVDTS